MSVVPEEHLSQRELRNESGRVLRAVAGGQSYVVTNAGVPVGRLVPVDAPPASSLRLRPASRRGGWAALADARIRSATALSETLDDLREDRL